jgi:hypothetical protein
MAERPAVPPGTLITLMPEAGDLGHLLRIAIDAEQVGASRIHLALEQPDIAAVVNSLRNTTNLLVTADPGHPAAGLMDVLPDTDVDAVVDPGPPDDELVARVASVVAAADGVVSIGGRGPAAIPVLLATLAAGGHVLVGTALTPLAPTTTDLRADPRSRGRDDAALVARASGLARLAGRPPVEGRVARTRWQVE